MWLPDAVWDVGTQELTGHEQTASPVERQRAVIPQMHHWTTSISITIDGDAATAGSDVAAA